MAIQWNGEIAIFKLANIVDTDANKRNIFLSNEQMKRWKLSDLKGGFCFVFLSNKRTYGLKHSFEK